MASAATVSLSRNDTAVLGALFDPEASLQNHATINSLARDPYDSSTMTSIRERERQALLLINEEKPTTSNINKTISQLSEIVKTYPLYASAWNNRSQATRMLFDLADASLAELTSKLQRVFSDLAKAISLATPRNPVEAISPSNAKVLASAHTHKAYILWRASNPEASKDMLCCIAEYSQSSKEELEEMASRHFALGGRYGNQAAQQLAVQTNPYAKLCGSIVKEALQKEMRDFYGCEL